MSNNININLKEKIDEFPEDIRSIAIEIISNLNQKNKSDEFIKDMIKRKVNNLVIKGK